MEIIQQDKLRSEARLQSIIQGSPIPQFVIDSNHHIIYWNEALEKYSGIRAEDVIGTNQQWRAFYPHERPCLADLLIDGTIDNIPKWYNEDFSKSRLIEGAYEATGFFPGMGKGGTWLYFTAAPVKDEKGIIIGAVETLEDITDLKRAEVVIRESERRYRHLVEAVTDYIFTVRIESGQMAETVHGPGCEGVTGYTSEDFATDPGLWLRMIVVEDRPAVFDQSRAILAGKDAPAIEHRIIRKDGVVRWVRNTPVLRHDPQGKLVAYDGLIQDITERMQADEALKQVIKKLNLLSNITRHDILNQLTALLGYLDLSQDHEMDPVLREYISKEQVSAETIRRQITFTRDYQTVGINLPVWQNVRATIMHAIGSLDLREVTLEISLGDIEVFADPLLEKVFYNLVENALRHGEKLTRIAIRSLAYSEGLLLVCEDDGPGIPATEKENIFQRKFFKHTGFGLFLSREILAITGLSIRETGEPGKGARFEIAIPNGAFRSTNNG